MTPFRERILQAEREILMEIGDRCRWNQLAMSAEMGVHRNTVARKLQELGIDASAERSRFAPDPPTAEERRRRKAVEFIESRLNSHRLRRRACQRCGHKRSHFHHPNPQYPSQIVWFCDPCQAEYDKEITTTWETAKLAPDAGRAGAA